jgi:hypothetical protein
MNFIISCLLLVTECLLQLSDELILSCSLLVITACNSKMQQLLSDLACNELGLNACYLRCNISSLPVLGSGADAANGMAHLVTFIHATVAAVDGA